jgi:hypothetical protein
MVGLTLKCLTPFRGQLTLQLIRLEISSEGVCHIVALPFTLKCVLRQKKKILWKLKYFTMQKYNLQKKSSERNQNPSKYYNSVNLKF